MSIRTFKIEIAPNKEVEHILLDMCRAKSAAWNWYLGLAKDLYFWKCKAKALSNEYSLELSKEYLSPTNHMGFYSLYCEYRDECEKEDGVRRPWMKYHSKVVDYAFKSAAKAYKAYFDARKKGIDVGPPKFKSSRNKTQSVCVQAAKKNMNIIDEKHFWFPSIPGKKLVIKTKEKLTKLREAINSGGMIAEITILKENDKWFGCFVVNNVQETKRSDKQTTIGVDWGNKYLAVTSENDRFPKIDLTYLRDMLSSAQREQSKLFRGKGQKQPRRWHELNKRISKIQQKIANVRKDRIHNATNKIAFSETICLEKLDVKELTKSGRGTIKNPGNAVKEKSERNRRNLDHSPYEFRRQIEYKSRDRGGQVISVDPAYTSQRCNKCGHVSRENRKTQSQFCCVECGHTENADLNAAKNIKDLGLGKWTKQQSNLLNLKGKASVLATRSTKVE